ncbi:MAG: DUF4349 domain-containing protein [Candidatus Magasanikbacteria bacterium]
MSKKNQIFIGVGIGVVVLFGYWYTQVLAPKNTVTMSNSFGGRLGSVSMEMSDTAAPAAMPMGLQTARADEKVVYAEEDGIGGPVDSVQEDRMIIKTGSLSLVVDNVQNTVKSISDYVKNKKGFVVTSNVNETGISPFGTVTVRVPATDFDAVIAEMKKMGDVKSETVNGRDITEEFVDLDAQLGNLRASEKQFLSIMDKAIKIEDVLAVQRELTWVRRDIERIEGRMKYLQQSSDLSTLTIHLSTDPDLLPVVNEKDQWKPLAVVKDAARSLLEFGQEFVEFLIWLVVYIPVWILIVLVVWFVRKTIKKHKGKTQNS